MNNKELLKCSPLFSHFIDLCKKTNKNRWMRRVAEGAVSKPNNETATGCLLLRRPTIKKILMTVTTRVRIETGQSVQLECL